MDDKSGSRQGGKQARCAESRERMIAKWRDDLKRIQNEVWTLQNGRVIHQRICEIVDANPRVQTGNVLYELIRRSYAVFSSTAIRRLLDNDERDWPVSFWSLVRNMEKNKHVITRDWFLSQCEVASEDLTSPEDFLDWEDANTEFNRFARDQSNAIDTDDLVRRFNDTKSLCKPVDDYATKIVAHSDRKGPDKPLTYPQLDEAIDTVDDLFQYLDDLLNQTGIRPRVPLINNSWDRVLEEPWIVPGGQTAR